MKRYYVKSNTVGSLLATCVLFESQCIIYILPLTASFIFFTANPFYHTDNSVPRVVHFVLVFDLLMLADTDQSS